VCERGGVNVSAVVGERVPPSLAAQHPGTEGRPWFATGVSLVLHPRNPHVSAFHANFRFFSIGGGEDGTAFGEDDRGGEGIWWFGGGADLTPAYPEAADVRAFHGALAGWCARHPQADYAAWKAACDAYFTVRHRGEMRGVGGVFFDELTSPGAHDAARATDQPGAPAFAFERDLACVRDGIDTLLPAYLPLVERHRRDPYGERERRWQALRRGRYAEFNLVYDRGTLFGLQTGGHIEAILMSLPPIAGWAFDHRPEPGSPEAAALACYQPRDWLDDAGAGAIGDAAVGAAANPRRNA